VNAHYEFGNDQMKFPVSNTKQKQRLTIKFNILEMCIYQVDCDFFENVFDHKFSIFEYAL
jgi:hypothetical protein